MVTIIACEVDTEVFTSDKMQVRLHVKKKKATDHDFYRCGVVVQQFLVYFSVPACCPVQVHACLGGDAECSPLTDEDFYQWEPQLVPPVHGAR